MTKLPVRIELGLGDRVHIHEADIEGVVTEHTEFLDGTHRWSVQYWHEGKRMDVTCEERELRLVSKAGA